MKLLIIEDEALITQALQRALGRSYRIDTAETGAHGLHQAEVNDYDTIMLDLNLPDMNGLDICKQLRDERIATPILVLTAQAGTTHKVALLDAGADDYLTKPFSLEELKARLRVLVRRSTRRAQSSLLVAGELVMDTATRQIKRQGVPIRLRRKEFELLEYLMHHAGAVISRTTIVEHIWDLNDALWTNAVDVHIKYLRDKVDRPFKRPLITTVHGVGYKLELPNSVAISTKEGGEAYE